MIIPFVDPTDRVASLLRTGVLSATPSGAAITGERWRLFGGSYRSAALAAAREYV